MKKLFFTLFLIWLITPVYAQRCSINDLLNIFKLTIEDQVKTSEISRIIKSNSENWTEMRVSTKFNEVTYSWAYKFDGSTRGSIYVIIPNDPIQPHKVIFQFPYKIQYDDYYRSLGKVAQLVNVLNEGMKQTRVYEGENLVFVLSVYPSEMNRYYMDGRSAPFYEFHIQGKINL